MFTARLLIMTAVLARASARDLFDLTGEVYSDLSVVVRRRGKECFYQPVDDDVETMYIQYTALREDILDELQFIVKDPEGKVLKQTTGESNSFDLDFTEDPHQRGTYSICFFNNHIIKDIIVYLEMEVWKEDAFTGDYEDDTEIDAEIALESVSDSLKTVAENVKSMDLHTKKISQRYRRDSFESSYSNSYVNNVGILTCAMIICAGLFQVYFIRNLFHTSKVHGIQSPT
ncbi:emp24/gp25L/p24 /GOLD [Branchiostoma belcheri]|nr:emp24/gp25L/p24 /GOLD [Branchiostoma belcheri]